MRYLLDTNVVSALRVRGRHPSVEVWAAAVPVGDQLVTATTIATRLDVDCLCQWDTNVFP